MSSNDRKPTIKQESGRSEKSKQRSGQRWYNNTLWNTNQAAKFKGKTDKLEGFIYDVGVANQAHLFATTTKEVSEYAERNLMESQDIRLAIEKVQHVIFTLLTKRSATGCLDIAAVEIIYKTDLMGSSREKMLTGRTNPQCTQSYLANVPNQCVPRLKGISALTQSSRIQMWLLFFFSFET